MVEETQKEVAETKKAADKYLKIFAIIFGIISIIVLIYLGYNYKGFLVWAFIIGGVVLLISLFMFFSSKIINVFKSKSDLIKDLTSLPKPASLVELRNIAKGALTNEHYCNHLQGCVGEKFYTVGKANKNLVYAYRSKAVYIDEDKIGDSNDVYILINCHYPLDRHSIVFNPVPAELNRAIQMLGTDPESEPEVEEYITHSPITGVTQSVKKITHKDDIKKAEEKKQEDLE